jgi:hypothetical protein
MKIKNYAFAGAIMVSALSQSAAFGAFPVPVPDALKKELSAKSGSGKFDTLDKVVAYLRKKIGTQDIHCFFMGCQRMLEYNLHCYTGVKVDIEPTSNYLNVKDNSTGLNVYDICENYISKVTVPTTDACKGRNIGSECSTTGSAKAMCKMIKRYGVDTLSCAATECKAGFELVKNEKGESQGWCRTVKQSNKKIGEGNNNDTMSEREKLIDINKKLQTELDKAKGDGNVTVSADVGKLTNEELAALNEKMRNEIYALSSGASGSTSSSSSDQGTQNPITPKPVAVQPQATPTPTTEPNPVAATPVPEAQPAPTPGPTSEKPKKSTKSSSKNKDKNLTPEEIEQRDAAVAKKVEEMRAAQAEEKAKEEAEKRAKEEADRNKTISKLAEDQIKKEDSQARRDERKEQNAAKNKQRLQGQIDKKQKGINRLNAQIAELDKEK